MNIVRLHRNGDGEMRLSVSIPNAHGDWDFRDMQVDRKTVLALIEDGARMLREDEMPG